MRLKTGEFVFIVTEYGLTGSECIDLAISLDLDLCVLVDGGGSSELIVERERKGGTGKRKIPHVLAFTNPKAIISCWL